MSGPQRKKPAIAFPADAKTKAIASLRRFASDHLEEEFGDLKAMLLLDYVLAELGPTIYNQAIADARTYLEERASDIEGVLHHPEFPSWGKPKR